MRSLRDPVSCGVPGGIDLGDVAVQPCDNSERLLQDRGAGVAPPIYIGTHFELRLAQLLRLFFDVEVHAPTHSELSSQDDSNGDMEVGRVRPGRVPGSSFWVMKRVVKPRLDARLRGI